MNRVALLISSCLLVVACGTPAPIPDSGTTTFVDSGTTSVDAGPQCFGVPTRLQAICVEIDFYRTNVCKPTREETVQAHLADCDAGRPVTRNTCTGSLESARWQYGPIGDTYECIYGTDGGLSGAINFSDHGVLAAGTVGDCMTMVSACP